MPSGELPPAHEPSGIAVRHHDDHGNGFAFGDQVVEGDARAAGIAPVHFVIAVAVPEVEDGEAPCGLRILLRRRVDVEPANGFQRSGRVGTELRGTVRDACGVHRSAGTARSFHDAGVDHAIRS
jgi:hypothetical protein